MKSPLRCTTGVAIGLTLALGLGACGSGKDAAPVVVSNRKLQTLRASSSALQNAGTARFTMTMSGAGVEMHAQGSVDLQAPATQMTMTMNVQGKDITMEERLVDGVLYVSSPLFASLGGAQWMKVDLSSIGADVSQLTGSGAGTSSATSQAEFLAGLDHVSSLGTEDVDGVTATHYRGVANLSRALEQAKTKLGTDSDVVEAMQRQIDQAGVAQVPVDVWIDGKNRPVKIVLDMKIKDQSVTMTMTYSDFGVPVNIVAPPADQVGDSSSILGQLGSASGASS